MQAACLRCRDMQPGWVGAQCVAGRGGVSRVAPPPSLTHGVSTALIYPVFAVPSNGSLFTLEYLP